MKHQILVHAGATLLLATAAFGQGVVGGALGAGAGVGRSVTGTVDSTVNGAAGINGVGEGLGAPVTGTLNATQNSALAAHVEPMLPPGTTVPTAAAGFENQSEFLSAVHVSRNLNIPFDQVKTQMTGSESASLGKAIKSLRPGLESKLVKDNVKLAERQAERDLRLARDAGKVDKVATSIASDSRLSASLTPMLPNGTTLMDAAAGFKNQKQFSAALQASKSLGIPFGELKDRITAGQSLGEAIQGLKPTMTASDAEASATIAEEQARASISVN